MNKHHRKMPAKFCVFLFVFSCQFFVVKSNLNVESTADYLDVLNKSENGSLAIPKITSMVIDTFIANRYAKTVIKSKVENLKSSSAETSFTVILPDNAFISEFFMEIDGKVYKSYVKEKEEAKRTYPQAVSSGQSAAHVEVSARDSKTFKVSVNLEPESKVTFQLGYEELLSRDSGYYNYVVNINPGQIVPEMDIRVFLSESRPLKSVQTPALRTGKEMNKNKPNLEPDSNVEMINSTCALVTFSPDEKKQQQIAEALGTDKENGFSGQFVVRYDVERDPYGGEVLVNDGYFVQFFSPNELEPLPKNIVFVLDHSGSTTDNTIDQIINAVENILSDLREEDFFSILRFHHEASIWDIETNKFTTVVDAKNYNDFVEAMNTREFVPKAVSASPENVEKAKIAIRDKSNLGMVISFTTNILSGLQAALYLIEKTRKENSAKSYQPMIVFLSIRAVPNSVFVSSSPSEIISQVTEINSKAANKTSIFSLALGRNADRTFLKKLSLKNLGFSRHIYQASDTSNQVEDFYKKISSPLLNNVTFEYVSGVKDVTKAHYPFLLNGSELVVAGKIPYGGNVTNIAFYIKGITKKGPAQFSPQTMESSVSLERLWAYLSLKEILKERVISSDEDASKLGRKALDLALKYSFVTQVSSLIVIKPNGSEIVSDPEEVASWAASPINQKTGWSQRLRPSCTGQGGPWPSRGRHSWRNNRRRGCGQNTATTQSSIKAPDWMEAIQNGNQTVTTSQGEFKLSRDTSISKRPICTNSPAGNGTCTLLNQCTWIYQKIPDLNTYITKYFCNIDTYAGVCCEPLGWNPKW